MNLRGKISKFFLSGFKSTPLPTPNFLCDYETDYAYVNDFSQHLKLSPPTEAYSNYLQICKENLLHVARLALFHIVEANFRCLLSGHFCSAIQGRSEKVKNRKK